MKDNSQKNGAIINSDSQQLPPDAEQIVTVNALPADAPSAENTDIACVESAAEVKQPSNLDDLEADKNYVSYEERVQQAIENNPTPPCSRDSQMDEKLSKYSTYGCIPFFLAAIITVVFDRAKLRSPWSFLLLGLASSVLAVGAILRYRNNHKCKCSVCETQGKTVRSSAILWSVLTFGCFVAFVVFLIINMK